MSTNPYQTPAASLQVDSAGGDLSPNQVRSLSAGAGWEWISEAFKIFAKNPLIWLVIGLIWLVLAVVTQLIPIIGPLAMSLLYAVFIAGFLYGCVALDNGEALSVGHLFAGFQKRTGPLIGLGGLYLGIMILVMIVVGAGMALMLGGMSAMDPSALFSPVMLILMLVIFALFIPVIMAFWFAPALISLGERPVMESLGMSFKGCLANIVPFLIYGLIMVVFAIIATIPLALGWLVLAPVLMISIYTGYRAIYTD